MYNSNNNNAWNAGMHSGTVATNIIILLINNLYECDQYDVQMYTIYTIEDTIFVQ